MMSKVITDYLYNLARRMEDGLVNLQEPPTVYDLADVMQLRDLAATLEDEAALNLTQTLSQYTERRT